MNQITTHNYAKNITPIKKAPVSVTLAGVQLYYRVMIICSGKTRGGSLYFT